MVKVDSEKRLITIMYCDLVNSTPLSVKLDPEHLSTVMHSFLDVLQESVSAYRGYTAGFTGDGIEAYFGFPTADEFAAYNAILASQRILKLIPTIASHSEKKLQVRIGIASGYVVIEEASHKDNLGKNSFAFGAVAPLACRLQESAIPNSVWIDQLTMNLAGKNIKTVFVGNKQIKGFEDAVPAYQIDHTLTCLRFDSSSMLTKFVGRKRSVEKLNQLWKSTDNVGRVVLIEGDAGVGKSRIAHEFLQQISDSSFNHYTLQCSLQHKSNPFYPWLRFIEELAQIEEKDSLKVKTKKLTKKLLALKTADKSAIEEIIQFVYPSKEHSLEVTPDKSKYVNFLAQFITNTIQKLSSKFKFVLWVEDIHWVDPSTQSVLLTLSQLSKTLPIFCIFTARPTLNLSKEFENLVTLFLEPLQTESSAELITSLFKKYDFDNAYSTERLIVRSGGNPLYIEELIKSLSIQGGKSDQDSNSLNDTVPESLHAMLMMQLDAYPLVKRTTQVAATFGRQFSFQDLHQMIGISEQELRKHINILLVAEIIFLEKSNYDSQYVFKHALLQETAYESQLNTQKEITHLEIANSLLELNSYSKKNFEIIADHFQKANKLHSAFELWTRASIDRLNIGATSEAVTLLKKADELYKLESVKKHTAGTLIERDFFLSFAKSLNATQGANSKMAIKCYERAANHSEALGDIDTQVHALDGQFGIIFNSGKLIDAITPAQKLIEIGISNQHIVSKITGLQSMGMIEFNRGNFLLAKSYLIQSIEDAQKNTYGLNSYPSLAYMYLSWTYLFLGEKSLAKTYCDKSLISAKRETPYSYGVALGNSCYYYQFINDYSNIRCNAEKLVATSEENGQEIWKERGEFFLHWVNAIENNCSDSLTVVADTVLRLLDSKEEVEATYYLGILAEAQLKFKEFTLAQRTVDKAIELAFSNGEFFYLVNLYSIKYKITNDSLYREKAITLAKEQGVSYSHNFPADYLVKN